MESRHFIIPLFSMLWVYFRVGRRIDIVTKFIKEKNALFRVDSAPFSLAPIHHGKDKIGRSTWVYPIVGNKCL